MSKIEKILKNAKWWAPVVISGIMAAMSTLGEQEESKKIDELESRIANLENGEES